MLAKTETFGDMSVVTTKRNMQENINDRGTVGLFLDYPKNKR
jgi:hypothetical protein